MVRNTSISVANFCISDSGSLQPGKVMKSGFCFPGLEQSWNLLSDKNHRKVMDFLNAEFDYQNA